MLVPDLSMKTTHRIGSRRILSLCAATLWSLQELDSLSSSHPVSHGPLKELKGEEEGGLGWLSLSLTIFLSMASAFNSLLSMKIQFLWLKPNCSLGSINFFLLWSRIFV